MPNCVHQATLFNGGIYPYWSRTYPPRSSLVIVGLSVVVRPIEAPLGQLKFVPEPKPEGRTPKEVVFVWSVWPWLKRTNKEFLVSTM